MLRRFLFLVSKIKAIAHTFNSLLWYHWNLSKDKIWLQTRQIQRGKWVFFDGANDYAICPQTSEDINTGTWDFCWSFWIKNWTTSWANDPIISTQRSNFSWWFVLYINSTTIRIVNTSWVWWYWISNTGAGSVDLWEVCHMIVQKVWWSYEIYKNNVLLSQNVESAWNTQLNNSDFLRFANRSFDNNVCKDMTIRDVRIYTNSKNGTQRQAIMDGQIDLENLVRRYKWDETNGTIMYDSVWWKHLNLINWPQHLTFTDGNGSDFQNQVWYTNNAWVLVPRNEAIPTQDVLGNPLQYSWRVKYDAQLWGRYYSFDGVNDYAETSLNVSGDYNISFRARSTDVTSRPTFYPIGIRVVWWQWAWIYFGGSNATIGGKIWVYDGVSSFINSNVTAVINQLYHVSVNRAWNNYTIFINGVNAWSWTIQGQDIVNFRFWARNDVNVVQSFWGFFKGDMYDVRVFNKIKTWAEINNIMNWEIDTDELVWYYKTSEWSWTIGYNSAWSTNNASLRNWVAHWSEQWSWSIARQRHWNTTENALILPWVWPRAQANWINFWTNNFEIEFDYLHTAGWWWFLSILAFSWWDLWWFSIASFNNQLSLWRSNGFVFMWSVSFTFSRWQLYKCKLIRNWSSFSFVVDWVVYTLSSFSWALWWTSLLYFGRLPWGNFLQMSLASMKVSISWTEVLSYDFSQTWDSIAIDSIWGNNATLFSWAFMWYTPTFPRNESNITQDIFGNPLKYIWDNQSLLPWWRVNFDTAPAPELIRLWVDQDYSHWDAFPASMTKTVDTYKENNFIIKNP